MATKFLEPGGDSTFNVATTANGGLWSVLTGTPTAATDFVHGAHVKSIGYATGVATAVRSSAVVADSGTRISFYLYVNAFGASSGAVAGVVTSGNANVLFVQLTSAGVIQLSATPTGAAIGGGGTILSTGVWYRICLSYTITSSTVNSLKLFVDGVTSVNTTNRVLQNSGSADVKFGNITGTALDVRTSDHYVDDSSALTDPGNVWVTAKRPFSNGTLNEWTTQIGSGGSGYGSGHAPQVNERPLSTTNGWSIQNVAKKVEEYTIESASAGDIDISGASIVDFMGWVDAEVGSASTGNIIVAGVATNISVTTSFVVHRSIAGSTTYPAGNTDIGIDTNTVNQLFSLAECGIIVAYVPQAVLSVSDSVTVSESVSLDARLTISVSDSISVSEFVGYYEDTVGVIETVIMQVVSPITLPLVFDSVTVSENIASSLIDIPIVNDSITVTESVQISVLVAKSVFDTVTLVETTTVLIPILVLSVFDSATITENVSVSETIPPSVSDSVSVLENVQMLLQSFETVNDTVIVSEGVQLIVFAPPSDFELVTVSESISLLLTSFIAVNDAITVSESVTTSITTMTSVVDLVSLAENIAITVISTGINSSEDISVSEFIALAIPLPISVSDALIISEQIAFVLLSYVSVADSVSVFEDAVNVIPVLHIVQFELTNVNDVFMPQGISIVSEIESVVVSEDVAITLPILFLTAVDAITVLETVTTRVNSTLVVSESVLVSESVSQQITVLFLVFESISVTESISEVASASVSIGNVILRNNKENRRIIKLYTNEAGSQTNTLNY